MTTPTLKQIYSADLLQRFPDHTFAETVVGSLTQVEFKDAGDAVVFESTNLVDGDAYKNIRENVVGFPTDIALHNDFDDIQTTDNTSTVISTIALDDESVYVIEATVFGIESDNSNRASYRSVGSFYRTGGGSVTQLGTTTVIFSEETAPSWTGVSFSVSGNNAQVEVQGAVGTTINWECIADILEFEP